MHRMSEQETIIMFGDLLSAGDERERIGRYFPKCRRVATPGTTIDCTPAPEQLTYVARKPGNRMLNPRILLICMRRCLWGLPLYIRTLLFCQGFSAKLCFSKNCFETVIGTVFYAWEKLAGLTRISCICLIGIYFWWGITLVKHFFNVFCFSRTNWQIWLKPITPDIV